jgi:serine/threonine-protein kinase HipA
MNGELVGYWTITAQGRHEFSYAESWLNIPAARPVSLSMPLRPAGVPYRDDIVEAFFDNLLPDSRDIRRRVQTRFGTASTAPFDLLAEIGRECVGALQLLPPDATPEDIHRINGERKTDAEVAAILRGVVATPALGQRNEDDFRISIAGAQEKTALLWHKGAWHRPRGTTPTTHIFKLPLGRMGNLQLDLTTSVENEWLCSRMVRAFGIPAAQCEMGQFEEQRVLIVERFDRRLSPNRRWWMRLPQEDLCQVTGTPPERRCESDGGPGIARIMEVLLGAREAQQDRLRFFKVQVLFWMLCAIDGHAKNFSVFIEPRGRYALTPLYDVISGYPLLGSGAKQLAPQKAKMAMAVSGNNRHYHWQKITRQHWLKTAGASGLASAEANRLIDELVHSVPVVVETISGELPTGFPAAVAGPVFEGLRSAASQLAG